MATSGSQPARHPARPAVPARRPRRARRQPRVGLALAGGGPLGAIYELGALTALGEAIPDLDLNALDGYVGVSAGAVIAAAMANGMTPRQLCAAFIEGSGPANDVIEPSLFVRPALAEYAQRAAALPRLVTQALMGLAFGRRSWLSAVEQLSRALPAGLFSNDPLQARLRELLGAPGRTDDFRQLQRRLVVVATDLDSGAAAPFGLPGWDAVPISAAVAASAALPGLFPPVPIDGPQGRRWYVDGALKKTLHARVLLDMDLDLVLCLNPLVPFEAVDPGQHRPLASAAGRIPTLVQGGLPVVLSQTFRTLIHSRLELGMKGYESSHPNVDLLLFEPDHHDPEMFLANLFSYSHRGSLAEHAYQRTRADLRRRRSVLKRTLGRHGLTLDDAVLDDSARRLLGKRRAPRPAAGTDTLRRLDEVLVDLERTLAMRAT